ncbi:uncharacterized protein PITG_12748 [Phytophthora infestans T30-4]|uniref:Secreted RxLR effector peptide protein n=1 Tax=Phytophthora infestans (strain T30-4) TaxID=403677 RepID=D0NL24_PHYIT|nr:uncharacterized protein PITG_12748 [Phytophthora infestans T30-4]EEY60342.1 hypothetical protein PITG_12748 [Phytophthora infestans T30-4]|eukprot:XP_002900138.1 hypothetical protein PITG_12748 [Phytophthora infestans T30-4]
MTKILMTSIMLGKALAVFTTSSAVVAYRGDRGQCRDNKCQSDLSSSLAAASNLAPRSLSQSVHKCKRDLGTWTNVWSKQQDRCWAQIDAGIDGLLASVEILDSRLHRAKALAKVASQEFALRLQAPSPSLKPKEGFLQ